MKHHNRATGGSEVGGQPGKGRLRSWPSVLDTLASYSPERADGPKGGRRPAGVGGIATVLPVRGEMRWEGIDSLIPLEDLQRERYNPPEARSAAWPYHALGARPPIDAGVMPRLPRGSEAPETAHSCIWRAAAVAQAIEKRDRASELLLSASPWFGMGSTPSRTLALSDTSSPTIAPRALASRASDDVPAPLRAGWRRAGAALMGIAASAAVLLGLWWSTSGGLPWSPRNRTEPGLARAHAAHRAPPPLASAEWGGGAASTPGAPVAFREAAIDGATTHAMGTCALTRAPPVLSRLRSK